MASHLGPVRGSVRLALSVPLLTTVIVLAAASPAAAHAEIVQSEPEAGATLGTAPGVVSVRFSEPLNRDLSILAVTTPSGDVVEGAPTGPQEMRAVLSTNEQGVYEVRWRTVSTLDGHTRSGSFGFGVGVSPEGPVEEVSVAPGRSDLLIGLARLVEDAALLALIGALVIGRLARRPPPLVWGRPPTRLLATLVVVGGGAVVLGEALAAAPRPAVGPLVAYLTGGFTGTARLWRLAMEVGLLLSVLRHGRFSAAFAAAALGGLVASGHAAAVQPPWWGILVGWVHLGSAAVWAGGIMALTLIRPPGGWGSGASHRLLRRFTPVALSAFLLTVGSGVLRGFHELGELQALWSTSYGQVLAVKLLAVVVMAQLSALVWARVTGSPRLEAGVAIVVVAAAAMLAAFPLPPARTAGEPGEVVDDEARTGLPEPGDLTLGSDAGRVLVGLSIRPAEPGPNDLLVYVQTLEGDEMTAALPVRVAVEGRQLDVRQCGPTCRAARADLAGGERVRVIVEHPTGGVAEFHLPELPVEDGSELLERMRESLERLRSYRVDERLDSGVAVIEARYAYVVPDRFESIVEGPAGRSRTVWIADAHYVQRPGEDWEVRTGSPSPRVPAFVWDAVGPLSNVNRLDSEDVDGGPVDVLTFYAETGATPVWFRLAVRGDGLVERAEMHAAGHFMDHRYHAWDAPIRIEPPVPDGRR